MSKTFPLQVLLDLAKTQSDEAARRLGELNRQNHDISNRLELLLQYRQEYQLRFDESVQKGMNQTELQNYRLFFSKLDDAIAQQQKLRVEFSQKIVVGQLEYQQKQKKLKSFETLADRHELRESVKAARREQKDQDEFSIKAFMRNRNEES